MGKRFKCYTYIRGDREVHPWYEIDASGSRTMGGSVRPPDTPAKIWSKMTECQQQSDALDFSLGRPGREKHNAGDGGATSTATSPLPPFLPLVRARHNLCRSRLRQQLLLRARRRVFLACTAMLVALPPPVLSLRAAKVLAGQKQSDAKNKIQVLRITASRILVRPWHLPNKPFHGMRGMPTSTSSIARWK